MSNTTSIFGRRRIPFVICLLMIACAVLFLIVATDSRGRIAYRENTINSMHHIYIALLCYCNDWSVYPDSLDNLRTESEQGTPYLEEETDFRDGWGNAFTYMYPGKHSEDSYDLYSFGPNGIDEYGKNDDITAWEEFNNNSDK